MIKAGQLLINLGAKNVLIKGGHLNSKQMNDVFLNKKNNKSF
jgi:hydroxymethylpyrimidine/phosphomethylpyrimidine kinase